MFTRLSAAALLALCATASGAAPPAGNRDVRCLLLSNLYAKAAAHPEGQQAAGQARLFYLGRVSNRLSGTALTAAMTAETKTIVPDQAGADMNKCLASVQSAATAVEAAGRTVQQVIVK